MKRIFQIPMIACLMSGLGNCANLEWVEPKVYTPPATEIQVEGLGIDGPVDLLPRGTSSIVITHQITNTGTAPVAAGYEITETVVQWVFRRNVASVGWRAGDPATHTVAVLSQPGPALAPGQSATISFGPIPVGSCGMFGETLTADASGVIAETSESDNDNQHLFFVPSRQIVNIAVIDVNDTLFHKDGRTNTHQFRITSGGAGNQWLYTGFSFIATEGSTADAMPPPAPGMVQGPGAQIVSMFVNPRDHSLPALGFAPSVKGKITAISTDGCVIAQKVAEALVEHE